MSEESYEVIDLPEFLKNIPEARFLYDPGHSMIDLHFLPGSDYWKKNPQLRYQDTLEYLLGQRNSYIATFDEPWNPIKTPRNLEAAKSDKHLFKDSQIIVPGWMLLVRSLATSILHCTSFLVGFLFVALSVFLSLNKESDYADAIVVTNVVALCCFCIALVIGVMVKSKIDLTCLPGLTEHKRFIFMLELVGAHTQWFKIMAWSNVVGLASFLVNISLMIWNVSTIGDGCKWSVSGGLLVVFIALVVFICNLSSYIGYEYTNITRKYKRVVSKKANVPREEHVSE